MAYGQLVFYEFFPQKESGWRECVFCGKIPTEAQPAQTVLLRSARSPKDEKVFDFGASIAGNTCELGSTSADGEVDGGAVGMGKVVQLVKNNEGDVHNSMFLAKRESFSFSGSFGHIKGEQVALLGSANFLNWEQGSMVSAPMSQRDGRKVALNDGMICQSLVQSCVNISSVNSNPGSMMETVPNSAILHMAFILPSAVEEGKDQSRSLSVFQQAQRAHNLLPYPQSLASLLLQKHQRRGFHIYVLTVISCLVLIQTWQLLFLPYALK